MYINVTKESEENKMLKKLITMGLAAMMAVSAMSVSAMAEEDVIIELENPVTITRQTDDGGSITIEYAQGDNVLLYVGETEIENYRRDKLRSGARSLFSIKTLEMGGGIILNNQPDVPVIMLSSQLHTYRDTYDTSLYATQFSQRIYQMSGYTTSNLTVTPDQKQTITASLLKRNPDNGDIQVVVNERINNTSAPAAIDYTTVNGQQYYFRIMGAIEDGATGCTEIR